MRDFNISIYSLIIQHFIDKETIQKVKAGTILFQEKDKVDHIYILLSGSIALGRLHMTGKEFTLKILTGEEILVEYQLFKSSPRYLFYAKTITDCEVFMINREKFEQFLLEDSYRLSAMTAWLSTRYLKAQMKCQDLILNGKKGALYSILIRLCNSYGIMTDKGIVIDLPLTHQELANLTYGTREVIQRLLKELREKNIISYERQKITIKNLNYLKEEVDCQNCPYEICGLKLRKAQAPWSATY
ncbi:Crp/Fnr family transcriptional regulator [Bacillus sp. Bva_UNVM-123]|uniref:Crp/Fnr family transcriptional regulator n=1 Tax=Bacillus sp. Bva_UNVM-123 TaxID=2829798 RepID=UPI00391F5490